MNGFQVSNLHRIIVALAVGLCLATGLMAQDTFAVIRDPDGYTNIREAGMKSPIVGKILKHQPFDCIADEEGMREPQKGMTCVDYPKYTLKDGYSKSDDNELGTWLGFINNSRVQLLSELPVLKQTLDQEYKAVFEGKGTKVVITTADFIPAQHVMLDASGKRLKAKGDNNKVAEWELPEDGIVETIDGERPWGVDGGVPREMIRSITVTHGGVTFSLPASAIKNIFHPSLDARYTSIHIGPDGELYLWMQNGDGAGGYNVIWVIYEGKLEYMYVATSWYA